MNKKQVQAMKDKKRTLRKLLSTFAGSSVRPSDLYDLRMIKGKLRASLLAGTQMLQISRPLLHESDDLEFKGALPCEFELHLPDIDDRDGVVEALLILADQLFLYAKKPWALSWSETITFLKAAETLLYQCRVTLRGVENRSENDD